MSESPTYDIFISYRHQDPDMTFADTLTRRLKQDGYRVALDIHDFAAHESAFQEMERCVATSRFFARSEGRFFCGRDWIHAQPLR